MAQRLYTGKDTAVKFRQPQQTVSDILQQHGVAMADVIKHRQLLKQRRKEALWKILDTDQIQSSIEADQAMMEKNYAESAEKQAEFLRDYTTNGNLSTEGMMKITGEQNRVDALNRAINGRRNVLLQAQTAVKKNPNKYDLIATQKNLDRATEQHLKNPSAFNYTPEDLLVRKPVNLDLLKAQIVSDVEQHRVKGGKVRVDELGGYNVLYGEEVPSENYARAAFAKAIEENPRYGDAIAKRGGIDKMVQDVMNDVESVTTLKRASSSGEDTGKEYLIKRGTTSEKTKLIKGVEETVQVEDRDGNMGTYYSPIADRVEGVKGTAFVIPAGAILNSSEKELLDLSAGNVVGAPAEDETKMGATFLNKGYDIKEAPVIKRYKTWEGEKVRIGGRPTKYLGGLFKSKKPEKERGGNVLHPGDRVTEEVSGQLSDEQKKNVEVKPFADITVKHQTYGWLNFSVPLTQKTANKLTVSPEQYKKYTQGVKEDYTPQKEEGKEKPKVMEVTQKEFNALREQYSQEELDKLINQGVLVIKEK